MIGVPSRWASTSIVSRVPRRTERRKWSRSCAFKVAATAEPGRTSWACSGRSFGSTSATCGKGSTRNRARFESPSGPRARISRNPGSAPAETRTRTTASPSDFASVASTSTPSPEMAQRSTFARFWPRTFHSETAPTVAPAGSIAVMAGGLAIPPPLPAFPGAAAPGPSPARSGEEPRPIRPVRRTCQMRRTHGPTSSGKWKVSPSPGEMAGDRRGRPKS